MIKLDKQKQQLLKIIEDENYSSIRFSIFENRNREWDTVINYNQTSKLYTVYLTMDRASSGRIFEFDNFDDACEKFLELMKNTVARYNYYKENGMDIPYSSPLWDKPQ